MPIGARIYTQVARPDPALVKRFAAHNSADLSDVMGHVATMDHAIAPVYAPMGRAVGVAVTASIPTGALSIVKEAVQRTQAGDLLVVNAFGNRTSAVVGGNIARGMRHRGLAGLIVDGAIRDVGELREDGLPVFASAVATSAGALEGPGEVNVPIACGRIVVFPGDIIVADEDGIVAIPPEAAEDVLARVAELEANHAAAQAVLRQGGVTGIEAIERQLNENGFEFIDAVARR